MHQSYLMKFFSQMKTSFWAFLLFACACFVFFGASPFNPGFVLGMHIAFLVLIICNIAFILYCGKDRNFFISVILLLAYILINNIKRIHGMLYWSTPEYCYLSILVPFAFLYFFFYNDDKYLFSKKTLYTVIALLGIFSVFEHLSLLKTNFAYADSVFGLNFYSFFSFILCVVVTFFNINLRSRLAEKPIFYAFLCVFMAFLFSQERDAFCIFFLAAALITVIQTLLFEYRRRYYDLLTGVLNIHSYLVHNEDDFPLKYSVGIICIDNYSKLLQVFKKNVNNLVQMIASQIAEYPEITELYRTDEDEFLLIFCNQNKNYAYDYLEEIRRNIAASEYVLKKSQNPVKITVSCSVSEKKRSDSDLMTVVVRARSAMKKTYNFTQNITSKA